MHSRFMRDDRGRFRAGRIIGVTVGGLVLATLLAVGLGWLVQWLWNNLMTMLFKLPAITYWQAVGLFLLVALPLFCAASEPADEVAGYWFTDDKSCIFHD